MNSQNFKIENVDFSEIQKLVKINNLDKKKTTQLIHLLLKKELAAKRIVTASTKNKGAVIGTTKKPWKQKGTGRARAGSVKSPIWRGGGVVFGPNKNKNYNIKISKKQRYLAFVSTLAQTYEQGLIQVIKDIKNEFTKVKDFLNFFYPLTKASGLFKDLKNNKLKSRLAYYRVLFIISSESNHLKKCLKNVPWIHFIYYNRLNINDLLHANEIILEENCFKKLNLFFKKTDHENN